MMKILLSSYTRKVSNKFKDKYITHIEYDEKRIEAQAVSARLVINFTSGKFVTISNQPVETIQELKDSILSSMERRNKAETSLLEKFIETLQAIINLRKT